MQNILHLSNITKRYPSVVANDAITIEIKKGEVHSLLGENGAGKTTLMKILYGIATPDEGEIYFEDKKVDITSPKDAISLGIGMVHQHFMLIDALTVIENIVLSVGKEHKGVLIDEKEIVKRVKEISEEYGLEIDPHARICDISVGQQQRVEIIKALYQDCKVLILDEPTAVLTPLETTELMRAINLFKSQGKSVIFISHKLNEVLEISDTITVLRSGKVVDSVAKTEVDENHLIRMMVGRHIEPVEVDTDSTSDEIVLSVENLSICNSSGVQMVDGLNMQVRAGEIYGVAGVDGNGQMELVKGIAALMKKEQGCIKLFGEDVTNATPKDVLNRNVAHIPEDRQTQGLIMDLSVRENLILNTYNSEKLKKNRLFLSWTKVGKYTKRLIKDYDVRTPNADVLVENLSGGNQQKIIVARALDEEPKLMLAVHPTRGVDIGAVEFIHKKILEASKNGCAVLLVSTDLDEVLALSNRIGVIYEGKIVTEMTRKNADIDVIGRAMAGRK